ncbi:MAG TPA: J domain-containing protein [Pirellulales bacterium]|jgi:hypothetical protein
MAQATPHSWPDSLDALALVAFIAVAIALPVLGYIFAYVDFRRYLRSLRRAISTIVYRDMGTPEWARPKIPRCVAVFGLEWPCSEDELTKSYRNKIKTLHPDRGGDERRFRMLQGYFEEALRLVREQSTAASPGSKN